MEKALPQTSELRPKGSFGGPGLSNSVEIKKHRTIVISKRQFFSVEPVLRIKRVANQYQSVHCIGLPGRLFVLQKDCMRFGKAFVGSLLSAYRTSPAQAQGGYTAFLKTV